MGFRRQIGPILGLKPLLGPANYWLVLQLPGGQGPSANLRGVCQAPQGHPPFEFESLFPDLQRLEQPLPILDHKSTELFVVDIFEPLRKSNERRFANAVFVPCSTQRSCHIRFVQHGNTPRAPISGLSQRLYFRPHPFEFIPKSIQYLQKNQRYSADLQAVFCHNLVFAILEHEFLQNSSRCLEKSPPWFGMQWSPCQCGIEFE